MAFTQRDIGRCVRAHTYTHTDTQTHRHRYTHTALATIKPMKKSVGADR